MEKNEGLDNQILRKIKLVCPAVRQLNPIIAAKMDFKKLEYDEVAEHYQGLF